MNATTQDTDIVTKTEDDLRTVESELERIGSSICSAPGGGDSWYRINRALEEVRNAIHNCYKISSTNGKVAQNA